jgi:hypothetical protein
VKQQIRTIMRRFLASGLTVILLLPGAASVSTLTMPVAHADDCKTITAPSGVRKPTGAEAVTYTYNSCGYWENAYYTWNPTTYVRAPKVEPIYNYNASTGKCDAKIWTWNPASESWIQFLTSVTTPPNGDPCIGMPDPDPPVTANSTLNTPTGGNTTDTQSTNNQTTNDTTNATLNNTVGSTATSGNSLLFGNVGSVGSLGGATSGNAQAIADIFNLLQSSSSLGSNVATFVANIDGDVQGDLIIDPSTLQPTVDNTTLNNNIDVNVANNGSINNTINLAAQSGDATVADNVNAGGATSGSAAAIANVVNMINSLVSASQSFLGVININGNLNGNILMPQNFLDSLIASNAPHEDISVSQDTLNQLSGQVSNNQTFTNNVNSTATSGAANATYNVNSGAPSSATTGTADTHVTIFNLADVQVSGGNTMLVFVNVLGKWVGVIMNAPAGSTAAAFGGGLTSNTTTNNNVNYAVANQGNITNNINVTAKTGDANVTENVNAGNAVSGNAHTAVNLANISNSSLNLTGWFGILFINVFGVWNGNFGVLANTPLGGHNAPAPTTVTGQMFSFVPGGGVAHSPVHGSASSWFEDNVSDDGTLNNTAILSVAKKVLGAHIAKPQTASASKAAVKHDHVVALLIGGALLLTGLGFAVLDAVKPRSRM